MNFLLNPLHNYLIWQREEWAARMLEGRVLAKTQKHPQALWAASTWFLVIYAAMALMFVAFEFWQIYQDTQEQGDFYHKTTEIAQSKTLSKTDKEFQLAQQYLRAMNNYGRPSFHVGLAGRELGLFYLEHHAPDKAIKPLQDSLESTHHEYGAYDLTTSGGYHFLGRAYEETGDYRRAELSQRQALGILLHLKKNVQKFVCYAATSLGVVLYEQGRYAKSKTEFFRAQRANDHAVKPDPQMAFLLTLNLAEVEDALGHTDIALTMIEPLLAKVQRGQFQNYGGGTYQTAGRIYWHDHQPERARRNLEAALPLIRKESGGERAPVARLYEDLGGFWRSQGQIDKARGYERQALAIYLAHPLGQEQRIHRLQALSHKP